MDTWFTSEGNEASSLSRLCGCDGYVARISTRLREKVSYAFVGGILSLLGLRSDRLHGRKRPEIQSFSQGVAGGEHEPPSRVDSWRQCRSLCYPVLRGLSQVPLLPQQPRRIRSLFQWLAKHGAVLRRTA